MAVDAYLVRAMTEADRFMARFVNVAPPELVALIERLESSQLVVSAMRNGIALRRIHCEVWAEFLDIEHELKGLVAQADFDHDLLPPWPMRPVVSEEVRRWERPTPGWTATGRRPLEVPRTPRSELPNLRFDPE